MESANKVVQQVLKSISSENRLRSKEVNWTKLLGQFMAVCNSHSGIRKNSVSCYEAVFGQKYHEQLQCNLSEMCECKSLFQRLKLSPNERLETYVREHNIVDVEVEDTDHNGCVATPLKTYHTHWGPCECSSCKSFCTSGNRSPYIV